MLAEAIIKQKIFTCKSIIKQKFPYLLMLTKAIIVY